MIHYCHKEKNRKVILGWLKSRENADNVKACVLHVMNMNHTEKKLSTCSKRMTRESKPWMFPFSKKESKENKQCVETSRFEEDGWNLKDLKDSKAETSKRLTKHHEPKKTEQGKNRSDVNLKKARLINDVRYQE